MAAELADHLDAKLGEALQVGATAIEAIETLEQKINQNDIAVKGAMESHQVCQFPCALKQYHQQCT
eukprot:SAG31_NODE_3200_length_4562_cov_7.550955_5_plen_66_part_00